MSDSSGAAYIEGMTAGFRAQLLDVTGTPVGAENVRMIVMRPGETTSFIAPSTVQDGFVYGTVNLDRPGVWRYRFETTVPPHAVLEEQFTVHRRQVPAPAGPGGGNTVVSSNWRINELTSLNPLQMTDEIAVSRGSPATTYRSTLQRVADLIAASNGLADPAGQYITPEQYGAIGDGESHPIGTTLGVSTLEELHEWENGIYNFADSLTDEMDWLAIQAAFYTGGNIVATPGARYKINRALFLPCGRINMNWTGAKLDGTDFEIQPEGTNLLVNPSFDSGITGWTQGTLGPRTDIVFSGGKASFTDPGLTGGNYGDFGQQITLPQGRWTVRLLLKISTGASEGFYGQGYVNMGFRPYGPGLGGYSWPHPLSFGVLQFRPDGDFEGWVTFDVEATEDEVTWLDIQGGNCDWEVQEASIKPFRMNYMVWATSDPNEYNPATLYDVSTWIGGELLGPVTGNLEDDWSGPEVGGILHKNFRGEGSRCNFERVFVYGWDVGITLSSQAFLNYFTNVNIGNCTTCVKFLAGSVNAGENYRFYSCIFFNSGLALHAEGGGEFNFWGCSFDFCQRLILLERAAKVSMIGHHLEFIGAETRLNVDTPTGSLVLQEILTGGTSGATARLLIDRVTSHGCIVVDVLSGTFIDNETISGATGTVQAAGVVAFAPAMIDLRGGSLLDYSGEMIQAGGVHRGAQHLINLNSLADTLVCHNWWAYGLNTASDTLVTGPGRFTSKTLLGPGNQNNPSMFQRTHNADVFGGNGRIIGAGTVADMGFEGPSDSIGLMFGAHSQLNTAPATRATITGEHAITVDSSVFRVAGHASLKLQMAAMFNSGAEFRLYIPVSVNDVILDEYYYNKPTVMTPLVHGPYTTAATPNEIFVSIESGRSVATVYDNQAAASYAYGPQAGWTVTFTNVTGDPGGIANAIWNATHTIVKRLQSGGVQYTIDLGSGNVASSTSGLAGGGTVTSTYSQTNVLVFDRRMWVNVAYFDSVGRPVITQASFQGENTITLPFAATGWVKRNSESHYQVAVIPAGDLMTDRYNNGRAPHWATHYMMVWNWGDIRIMDLTAPPPLYLTDFFANRA